jgi:hypothetical protein
VTNDDGTMQNTYLDKDIPNILAISSASTGSAYNSNEHQISPIAPGVITIISKKVQIKDSQIISGY